jgi:hypothetical protein
MDKAGHDLMIHRLAVKWHIDCDNERFTEEMMKIQNRSSVLSTGIWKISDMSQAQETQNAAKPSQTESIVKTPTEAQRNQQLGEFKSQEQLLRASIEKQLPPSLNNAQILSGLKVDKEMDGLGEMHLQLSRVQELINGYDRIDPDLWDERTKQLYYELLRLRDSLSARIEAQGPGERTVVAEGESGPPTMGARPSRRREEIIIYPPDGTPPRHTGIHWPSLVGKPGRGRWRRPSSNDNLPNPIPTNQKSDAGSKNIHYSNAGNHSNDSRESSVDNRDFSPDPNPQPPEPPAPPPDKKYPKGDKHLANDPATGDSGNSKNDIGANGRIPKGSPDNRSGIQQMVQPGINLFSTTTGADDEEHPIAGNTQETTASEGNDLGDDLPYDLNVSGGSVDIDAGKVLFEQIRPINPGGPDPTKIK